MGQNNNPAPGALNLHEEVSLSEVKLEVSQGTKAAYEKAYADMPASAAPEPQLRESGSVTFEEFLKVDFRVGTVKTAERVPKSDKLLKLTVSFGNFDRQILAGVGKTFQPEDLVNKQYLFVVNLPPKKMMGLESHGMLLATGAPESLSVVSPSSSVPDGSRLG